MFVGSQKMLLSIFVPHRNTFIDLSISTMIQTNSVLIGILTDQEYPGNSKELVFVVKKNNKLSGPTELSPKSVIIVNLLRKTTLSNPHHHEELVLR